ncbi:hypothetical protein NN561_009037 [Cricetulus griseus]
MRGAGGRRAGVASRGGGEFARTGRPLSQGLRVELATRGRSLRAVGGARVGRAPDASQGRCGRGGGARRQRVASWAAGGLEGAEEEEEEERLGLAQALLTPGRPVSYCLALPGLRFPGRDPGVPNLGPRAPHGSRPPNSRIPPRLDVIVTSRQSQRSFARKGSRSE